MECRASENCLSDSIRQERRADWGEVLQWVTWKGAELSKVSSEVKVPQFPRVTRGNTARPLPLGSKGKCLSQPPQKAREGRPGLGRKISVLTAHVPGSPRKRRLRRATPFQLTSLFSGIAVWMMGGFLGSLAGAVSQVGEGGEGGEAAGTGCPESTA